MKRFSVNPVEDERIKNHILNDLYEQELRIQVFIPGVIQPLNITGENIVSESMTLKQDTCDGSKFRFGGCIASELSIQLIDTEELSFSSDDLVGSTILVSMRYKYLADTLYPSGSLYPSSELFSGQQLTEKNMAVFRGKIDSAKVDQSNQIIRNVVAYDPISRLFGKDISVPLRSLMKAAGPDFSGPGATIPSMLSLVFSNENISYEVSDFNVDPDLFSAKFRNYDFENSKDKISKGELLRDICEVCFCCGFFRAEENKFRAIRNGEAIIGTEVFEYYESLNAEEKTAKAYGFGILFPFGGSGSISNSDTKTAVFSIDIGGNYLVTEIDNSNNDLIYSQNYYDMSDNILGWDYRDNGLQRDMATISKIYSDFFLLNEAVSTFAKLPRENNYTPLTATVDGRLWLEPGDYVQFKVVKTNTYGEPIDSNGNVVDDIADAEIKTIQSRVFSRTLTGILALTDNIEAKGEI